MMHDAQGRWLPDASYIRPQVPIVAGKTIQLPGAIGPSNGDPQHVGVMPARP